MKIATFNVNSIRKRLPAVLDWLARNRPDVLCLQETKVQDADFPLAPLKDAGYFVTYRGMKAYNGVATLTLAEPTLVAHGFDERPDNEDVRLLRVEVGGVTIVNSYVPQGYAIDSDKYRYKLDFFRRLREYFETYLDPGRAAVWLGDLNVAPEPIDVYHPEKRVNDPDFHIDARNAFKAAAAWGFTDVFRQLHPDRVQYTYWDYFRRAFEHNWGWRIDHILATPPMAVRCRAADVDVEPRKSKDASDHTILWAEFGEPA
ncbi:MAG: exodeoxyribonuclease III [Acidobacteria bacterium]|nr:exodeoxyribonuclease III [Acidobacteriota bacterium]